MTSRDVSFVIRVPLYSPVRVLYTVEVEENSVSGVVFVKIEPFSVPAGASGETTRFSLCALCGEVLTYAEIVRQVNALPVGIIIALHIGYFIIGEGEEPVLVEIHLNTGIVVFLLVTCHS